MCARLAGAEAEPERRTYWQRADRGMFERSAAHADGASPRLSDTFEVISLDLARRLHDAGLAWSPENGDRFWLPERMFERERCRDCDQRQSQLVGSG